MRHAQLGIGIVALFCVIAGGLHGQDKKEAPVKGQLPPQWKKLGLNDDQLKKIYAAQTEYRGKIAELKDKIKDLEKQERAEMEKVLTDGQKARLREILLEKAPTDKKDASEKKDAKDDKKDTKDEKK